jgi:NitT/TauT family transport system permease protein
MARSFGARERTALFKVRVPAGAPLILEGLRLGLGHAVKGMINGELFIALSGLGGLAAFYGHRLDMASLLAITLIVLIAAIVLDLCFGVIERRLTAWL